MKYLSTLLFALCLGWTWKVIHSESPISFQTHAALQTKLAEIIAKTIEKLKPESANFKMDYLWTEILPTGQIKAHFSYKFDEVDKEEDIVQTGLEGYAILQKEQSVVANQDDHWTVTEVKTNNGTLNFREGLVITADKPEKPEQLEQTDPSENENPTPTELTPTELTPKATPDANSH